MHLYSITSSARVRSVGGISIPRANKNPGQTARGFEFVN